MRTVKVLHSFLSKTVPGIHATRLSSLMAAVEAALTGAKVTITDLGRHVNSAAFTKHNIKRMDRLVGNPHLFHECHQIYAAVAQHLVKPLAEPIIIIDWSPLSADQEQHVLRASLPVRGRTLTLYEEIHPRKFLGSREIQHRFLDKLKAYLPASCQPIIVADAGFRVPFYRYVEQLKWHWVGRIRSRDFIAHAATPEAWYAAALLHEKAKTKPVSLGVVHWVRRHPLLACVTIVRHAIKNRHSLTLNKNLRQSKLSKVHSKRESEPWLLVHSVSLKNRTPKQIVKIYKTRMQIEEGFRDSKSATFGLGVCALGRVGAARRAILLLITALAIFLLWMVGTIAATGELARRERVNSSSKSATYSVIFMARLLVKRHRLRLSKKQYNAALAQIARYISEVLSA
jgi:Transposase DDE domain